MTGRRSRWQEQRENLLRRGALERQDLAEHLENVASTLDSVDRGLALVRRVATPPVLLGAGVAVTLLLGRGGVKRAVAGGLALAGLLLRARSAGRLVSSLGRSQAVRRSR